MIKNSIIFFVISVIICVSCNRNSSNNKTNYENNSKLQLISPDRVYKLDLNSKLNCSISFSDDSFLISRFDPNITKFIHNILAKAYNKESCLKSLAYDFHSFIKDNKSFIKLLKIKKKIKQTTTLSSLVLESIPQFLV